MMIEGVDLNRDERNDFQLLASFLAPIAYLPRAHARRGNVIGSVVVHKKNRQISTSTHLSDFLVVSLCQWWLIFSSNSLIRATNGTNLCSAYWPNLAVSSQRPCAVPTVHVRAARWTRPRKVEMTVMPEFNDPWYNSRRRQSFRSTKKAKRIYLDLG